MNDQVPDRYNDLKAVPGHKNWYRNPISLKLTWRRRGLTVRTGLTQITKAKEFLEIELARLQGRAETSAKKRLRGVSNPGLADAWELLIEEKKADTQASTIASYNKNWRVALEPFWGTKFAQDLTPQNIHEYKLWYLANHPKRYFKKTFIHFQVLNKFLLKQKFINALPDVSMLASVDDVTERASKRIKAGRVYTRAELKALQEAALRYEDTDARGLTSEHKEILGLRAQLGVAIGAKCGMRKMEALALEWGHVDSASAMLKVWSQKNNKWREVPMVPDLVKLFEAQRRLTGESRWVFPMPSDPDRHISGQVFDKVWVKVKKTAKIKGRARFHDLRHTFATTTAEDNWNPVTACAVLDMGLHVYQRIYCKPSFEKKAELMLKSFGGAA